MAALAPQSSPRMPMNLIFRRLLVRINGRPIAPVSAGLINTRVETAIRIMSRWNKEGPVKTEKTGFLVVDTAKLDEIASRM